MVFLWLVAASSVCLGIQSNQFSDNHLSLVYQSSAKTVNAISPAPSLPKDVPLDDFHAYVKEKRGLVLDARPEIFYRFGHVPGALSLPRDEFEKGYTQLKAKLEANKSQLMIIYCSDESCEDSDLVYQALTNLGYTQISIFRGGWDVWAKAGLPEEK